MFILLISFQSQIWRLLFDIFLNSWLPARWLASLTTVGYRSAALLLLKISISVPYQSPQSPNKGSWGLELYSFLFHQISLLSKTPFTPDKHGLGKVTFPTGRSCLTPTSSSCCCFQEKYSQWPLGQLVNHPPSSGWHPPVLM